MKEECFHFYSMVLVCEREISFYYLLYGQGVKEKFVFIICPMVPGCEREVCFYHLLYGTRM